VTGLGLTLGEGEQDTDPSCNRSPGQVVVTRSRQTLPLRRLGTYGHVVDHRTTTEVRVPADGGVVEVTCQHAVLGGSVRVLVGLQPLTSHTTRLHVAARVQGPPAAVVALRGALRLATLTSRRGSRAATRAEAVADETLRRRDAELTAVSTLRSHLAEGADL
jgi:hypothetical protein